MRTPKVLVACEESQTVCMAFREIGIEAYSCDIQEPSGNHPEFHILGDALEVLEGGTVTTMDGQEHEVGKWDLLIAHPPCTHLAVSGQRWFKPFGPKDPSLREDAVDFFMAFALAPIEKICIENPVSIIATRFRPCDQKIHPWQYGHEEEKSTCLWLKGLPKLEPTKIVENKGNKLWKLPPSQDRAKLRSKTFPGIATAMADQWGDVLLKEVEND